MPRITLRPMTLDDLDEVVELDRLGFSSPWSRSTYRYEIQRNDRSTMIVLENKQARHAAGSNGGGWLRKLFGGGGGAVRGLVGYAGYWQIVEEAHISTITVHPEWRGNRLGELLLWSMIDHAIHQGATKVSLEVRVSNTVAKRLYEKYGFEIVGRRRRYYRDNNEDADVMMVEPLDDAYRAQLAAFRRVIDAQIDVIDRLPYHTR